MGRFSDVGFHRVQANKESQKISRKDVIPIFSKVLVANRGEIAVRVQQTLKTLGIATVAVFSDPDASSPHVSIADEAWALYGHTAEETYLDIDKIMAIALKSGAEAIHPGYGFLSDNPRFVRSCLEAGMVFIGPTPENMEALGDKIRSKELAQKAGTPVVPSGPPCTEVNAAVEEFVAIHGFPLLIKAAAGGGGRGMRLVTAPDYLAPALESAGREANAAFGDGRVFLERYIQRPRHVEIQVLADGLGNTVHLLERDCSIQRRYQKIIEETPSPALSPELRSQMGDAAVAVAKSAGYLNAGTVEFLLNTENSQDDSQFFFLEMNTRLQVEHPITEQVLGLDLVEWQVRIAAGESLTLSQDEVQAQGHAVECRIYAEDPSQNFVPSSGKLAKWLPPSGPGLRLDSGVSQGQEVSTFYDPMLAKLIAWGPDRVTSLKRMELALSRFAVLGPVTNIPFLQRLVRSSRFVEGDYDTGFLSNDSEPGQTLLTPELPVEDLNLARSLAAWLEGHDSQPGASAEAGPDSASSRPVENDPWRTSGRLRLP